MAMESPRPQPRSSTVWIIMFTGQLLDRFENEKELVAPTNKSQWRMRGSSQRNDWGGGKCHRHEYIIAWPSATLSPRSLAHKYSQV